MSLFLLLFNYELLNAWRYISTKMFKSLTDIHWFFFMWYWLYPKLFLKIKEYLMVNLLTTQLLNICYIKLYNRFKILFADPPPTKPMIYALSSSTVRSVESIQAKCNLSSLGYPKISWRWFCGNQAPISGTSVQLESYQSLNINFDDKTIGCRCRGTSSGSYYQYNEFSDVVEFTIFCK